MDTPARTGALDEQQILLSTLPPSRGQKRLALAIVLLLLAAFCATVPFAAVPVGYIREFHSRICRRHVRDQFECRTRLLPRFLDARAGRPAFRNRLALCATRPFRDGAKARTRSAADDDGRVVGLDRARDEPTASQYRDDGHRPRQRAPQT